MTPALVISVVVAIVGAIAIVVSLRRAPAESDIDDVDQDEAECDGPDPDGAAPRAPEEDR